MAAPIRHLIDRDGHEYDFVATVPGVDVTAETLPEGERATGAATVDRQTGQVSLALGLPRGATGAKGDKGDAGAQGPQGERGPKGDAGVSVTGVSFDEDGGLSVKTSDGKVAEYGGVTTAVKAAEEAKRDADEAKDSFSTAASKADASAEKAETAASKADAALGDVNTVVTSAKTLDSLGLYIDADGDVCQRD